MHLIQLYFVLYFTIIGGKTVEKMAANYKKVYSIKH